MENHPQQETEFNPDSRPIELTQEALDTVMSKVDDIDRYGVAFSSIGEYSRLIEGGENSKLRSILKYGLVGVSPDRPGVNRASWGVPNSVEEYVGDLKAKRERPPEVFFNVTGRYGYPESEGVGTKDDDKIISRIPLVRDGRDHILVTFPLDKFLENNVRQFSREDGENQGTKKGTFTVHNYGRMTTQPNSRGDVNADSDYGFKLSSRVQPRMFNGIVFRKSRDVTEEEIKSKRIYLECGDRFKDREGGFYIMDREKNTLYTEDLNPESLKQFAQDIAQELVLTNEGKDQNIVPIYDFRGNLWWPKQMTHEEIVEAKENININENKSDREEPALMSAEEFNNHIEFFQRTIIEWYKIKPDIIFVGEARAVTIGIALKYAYKEAFPEEDVKFYRLSPQEVLEIDPVPSDSFIKNHSWTRKGYSKSDREVTTKWLNNFETKILNNLDNAQDKKVLFYDWVSTELRGKQPVQVIRDGEPVLDEEGKPVAGFAGGRTVHASTHVLRHAFKNVWVQADRPEGFDPYASSIIAAKFSGPRKDDKRQYAEQYLSDMKMAAKEASKRVLLEK